MKRRLITGAMACGLVLMGATLAMADDNTPVSQLDEIVVTADRGESAKKEVTSNITIIDFETIQNSAAKDLSDLLVQQGLHVRKYPGTLANVGMRGFRSDSHGNDLTGRVIFLLNGHRIASGNAAILSLANIQRVEIIRGPAAVQYGAAAMGGVVNVITRAATSENEDYFTTTVEAGIGSYNSYKTKVAAAANVNNFDATFGYNYFKSDDYRDSKGDRYHFTRNNGSNSFNVNAGYTFLNTHRIGFNVYYFGDENYGPNSKYAVNFTDPRSTYDKINKTNYSGDVNYSGATYDNMFAWFLRYGAGEDRRIYKTHSFTDNLQTGKTKYTVDSQFGQAQLTFNSSYITLTGGLDYLDYDIDDIYSSSRKSEYRNYAGFIMGKLRLLDERLVFSAGGRYDDFKIKGKSLGLSYDDDHFSPSVGVAVLPFNWLKLRANYAQGFMMPTPTQAFGGKSSWGGPDTQPNYSLKPEKNDTYEIGFDIGWNYLDFSFTYFHSRGKDSIASRTLSNGDYQYYNVGKSRYSGIEVEFSGDVAKALGYSEIEVRPYFNLNYMTSYKSKANGSASWEKLMWVPELTMSYGVRFAYPEYNFTTTLNASYYGKEKANRYLYDYSVPGSWPGMTTVPISRGKFTVVDWSARKQLLEFGAYGKMDIKVEVNNLFNQKYAYVDGYPMPGRNFYVGLVYSY